MKTSAARIEKQKVSVERNAQLGEWDFRGEKIETLIRQASQVLTLLP